MSFNAKNLSARSRAIWLKRKPRKDGFVLNDQPLLPDLAGTSPPKLALAGAGSVYPPKLDIGLNEAVLVGDTLRLQAASDPAFIYRLFDTTHVISGGDAAARSSIIAGLAAIARPAQTFFRARIERGSSVTTWSQAVKHGDSAPPVITSAATATYAEMAPLSHLMTCAEPASWRIVGGRDASSLELNGAAVQLSGNAILDHEVQANYQIVVRATDWGGNTTDQRISIQVSNVGEQANSFSFAPARNVALSQLVSSNPISIAGLAAGVSVTAQVAGGSYSKNNASFTAARGQVTNGDVLVLQTAAAADFSTTREVTLTLGGGAEAVSGTFVVATLADPQGVGWIPEPVPAIRNVAYQSLSAEFPGVHFGIGLGIVMVSSGRRIELCTIDGLPARLVSESGVRGFHASIWAAPVAKAGPKLVRVGNSALALSAVAISTGTLQTNAPQPQQIASRDYGYYPAPVSLGTVLTVPPHGLGLIVAVSETGTIRAAWSTIASEGNVRGGSEIPLNHAFAHIVRSGTPEVLNWSYSGTAFAAAVWGT